jgi:hypothetical protein
MLFYDTVSTPEAIINVEYKMTIIHCELERIGEKAGTIFYEVSSKLAWDA